MKLSFNVADKKEQDREDTPRLLFSVYFRRI